MVWELLKVCLFRSFWSVPQKRGLGIGISRRIGFTGWVVYWHICFQLMLQLWSHQRHHPFGCLWLKGHCYTVAIYHDMPCSWIISWRYWYFLWVYLPKFISWQIAPVGLPRFLWILYCRCWAFKMRQGHYWRCLEKRWRGWPWSFLVNDMIEAAKESLGILGTQ